MSLGKSPAERYKKRVQTGRAEGEGKEHEETGRAGHLGAPSGCDSWRVQKGQAQNPAPVPTQENSLRACHATVTCVSQACEVMRPTWYSVFRKP